MKKMMVVLVGLMVSGASMQAINVRPQRPAPTPVPVQTMPVVEQPVQPVVAMPVVEQPVQPVVAMPVIEQPAQPETPVAVMEPEVTMPEIPANATPEQKKGIVAQMKGKARAGYDTAKKWVGAHKKEVAAAVGFGAVAAGAAVGARQYKKGQQGQQGLEGQQQFSMEYADALDGYNNALQNYQIAYGAGQELGISDEEVGRRIANVQKAAILLRAALRDLNKQEEALAIPVTTVDIVE